MTEVVLDASVVIKWFHAEGEEQAEAARSLRRDFLAGELVVVVPPLLYLEILNVAGRRWSWPRPALIDLAVSLRELRFETREPGLTTVAEWTSRGLTSYDAAYVALAESEGLTLVTGDERILSIAPRIAAPLKNVLGSRRFTTAKSAAGSAAPTASPIRPRSPIARSWEMLR